MSSLLSRYPKHSLVTGHVTTVTGVGALVTLSDGVRGHIHARELAWANVDQPRRFVREGQQLDAVVIGEDPVRHVLLLSRRLALRDPWPMIGETYPLHSTWEGRISQVTEHGAFIELEPGVVGLARPADLPQAEDEAHPLDLWPDDWVLVRVLTLDPHRHRIGLSVRAVIEERDQALAGARFAGSPHGTTIGEQIGLRSDPLQAAQPPWRAPTDSIRSILLVDDDHEFGANTAAWLAGLGYETAHRSSVAAAREILAEQTFDLLLLDYDLGDGDGLSLARDVVAHNPQIRIVLLSGQAELQFCRRAALPQLTCWSKPFTMGDFAELLRQISEGSCRICQQRDQPVIATDLLRRHGLDRQTLAPLDVLCRSELFKLVAATEAQVGMVCTVEGGSQQVRVITHEGAGLNLREPELLKLIHSPVNDVCTRGEVVHTADMTEQPARFRYLLPLGNFRSCIGMPIPSGARAIQLGFFLFHQQRDRFSETHMHQALVIAGFLGLKLERQHVLQTSLAAQQVILAGRLSLSTAHEIQKQISAIGSQIELLNVRLQKLRRQRDPIDYTTLIDVGIPEIAVRLQRSVQSAGGILQRQLDFARPYNRSSFDLNQLVERTAQMIQPYARQEKMYLDLSLDRTLPRLNSAPLLIQQIILNLAFNAVEQMALARHYQGRLLIQTMYLPDDEHPIRILFDDTGPGIHAAHSERLFQHGFSTRPNGTGLGLYISRAAAESLGGQLELVESFVGYGSTFELALPIHDPEVHA
jgi:signal transduction histidine kinase/predicted RNA-binding protein with RPS1 domain/DNA-binding NarL/FixJ family response regulator